MAKVSRQAANGPKVTVLEDIEGTDFKKGQTYTTRPSICAYLKADYNATHDEPTEAKDEQIWQVFQSVEGDSADAHAIRLQKIGDLSPEPLPDTRQGVAFENEVAEALTWGGKFPPDADKVFVEVADAAEKFQGAPLLLVPYVEQVFGKDIVNMPIPGTWPVNSTVNNVLRPKALPFGSNAKPDHRDSKSSFWANVYAGTPSGSKLAEVLAAFKKASEEERALTVNEAKRVLELTGEKMSPEELISKSVAKSVKDRAQQRYNNSVKKFRLAIDFVQQRARFADELPDIRVQFVQKQTDLLYTKRLPIKLIHTDPKTGDVNEYPNPISLTKFCSFKAEEAGNNGGTFAALDETVKKKPGEGSKNKVAEAVKAIFNQPNVQQVGNMLESIEKFFEDSGNQSKFLTGYLNDPTKGDINLDTLKNVVNLLAREFEPNKSRHQKWVDAQKKQQAA